MSVEIWVWEEDLPAGALLEDVQGAVQPARWVNTGPTRVLAIAFPRSLLPLRRDDVTQLTAVGATSDAARVGTAAVDLLTVALGGRLDGDGEVPTGVAQRVLIRRVHAFIGPGAVTLSSLPASSRVATTSPSDTCTSCSRGSGRVSLPPSRSAGWSVVVAICWIRSWPRCR